MKKRTILFSAPMVRALLDSTKTQTRRLVKIPHQNPLGVWEPCTFGGSGATHVDGTSAAERPCLWHTRTGEVLTFPHGLVGDRLWVRESFWGCDLPGHGDQPCVVYDDEWQGKEYSPAQDRPWARKFGRIPSIHMPLDCSRITLEIVSVRVERLNEISEADAKAEGITPHDVLQFTLFGMSAEERADTYRRAAVDPYRDLWESINGAGSWAANPWVWVINFRRIKS